MHKPLNHFILLLLNSLMNSFKTGSVGQRATAWKNWSAWHTHTHTHTHTHHANCRSMCISDESLEQAGLTCQTPPPYLRYWTEQPALHLIWPSFIYSSFYSIIFHITHVISLSIMSKRWLTGSNRERLLWTKTAPLGPSSGRQHPSVRESSSQLWRVRGCVSISLAEQVRAIWAAAITWWQCIPILSLSLSLSLCSEASLCRSQWLATATLVHWVFVLIWCIYVTSCTDSSQNQLNSDTGLTVLAVSEFASPANYHVRTEDFMLSNNELLFFLYLHHPVLFELILQYLSLMIPIFKSYNSSTLNTHMLFCSFTIAGKRRLQHRSV